MMPGNSRDSALGFHAPETDSAAENIPPVIKVTGKGEMAG